MRDIRLQVLDAYIWQGRRLVQYMSTRITRPCTSLAPGPARDGCISVIGTNEEGHTSTVTSSLFVKLPLSVQVPCTRNHIRAMLSKGIQRVHPNPTQPIQLSRQEEENVARTKMRNAKLQNSPQSVVSYTLSVSMVSRTFWTLFLLF